MRSLVVFGRGGPRGPPARPRYLSQAPPKLQYNVQSILNGNPFEILASTPEKSYSEVRDENDPMNQHDLAQKPVVLHDEIPNSTSTSISAPESKTNLEAPTQSYTKVVRGRSRPHYFNTKIKQSSKFTQKLKESVLKLSSSKYTSLNMNASRPDDTTMEVDVSDTSLVPESDENPRDDASMDEVTQDPTVTLDNEFHLTPEEERALLDHDLPMQSKKSSLQKSLTVNPIQPDIKRFFTSKTSSNIPSVPKPTLASAVNVSAFTSDATSDSPSIINLQAPPTIQDQNKETHKIPIRTTSKRELTCRFKIRIGGGTCNLPLLVKQVVKLYRGIDPSLSVLPTLNPEDDSLILDHEDSIPETEEELKQWVTNIIPNHERVHFTMRFSVTKTLHLLCGPVFAWMKHNRSYVKMDTIKSERIVTLGFFEGFHPDFQNRDRFKKYCLDYIRTKGPQDVQALNIDDFSIYPRAVYVGTAMDKVTTRAMVIEVGVDHSSSFLNTLSSAFNNEYSEVTFVPFMKMDEDYQVLLKMAMLKQNKLLHNIKRKQIRGLINPHSPLQKTDGQVISLCQWLQSARDENSMDIQIIRSVEETKYNTSSVLYYEKNTEQVLRLCKDLKTNMETHFPASALATVFTDSYSPFPVTLSRIISDEEATWASIIKRKYLPNPQDCVPASESHVIPPSKFRKSVYYGTTKTPSQLREDTHAPVDQVSDTTSLGSITTELSFKYQELEKQFQALVSSQEKHAEDTKTYVDNSIAAMEENLNIQIQNNTTTIQKQISTLETTNNNQFTTLAQTLNAVAGNVNLLLSNFSSSNGNSSTPNTSTTITALSAAVDSGKH